MPCRVREPWAAAISGALGVILASAQDVAGETIPVSVTDLRFTKENSRLRFTLRNDAPDRLIAWSVQIALTYPDGYISRGSRATHCHTTALERAISECEIGPGEQREQHPYGIRPWVGQPPEVNATVESAIFEDDRATVQRWLGNREPLEGILREYAETQRAWGQILAILEKAGSASKGADGLQDAYDRLGREGPKHAVTERVRTELARDLAAKRQGLAEMRDPLETWIATARHESTPRPHSEP